MNMRHLIRIVENAGRDRTAFFNDDLPRPVFGRKGVQKDDQGAVVQRPVGREAEERLAIAKTCRSAAQYAMMMNQVWVERGDQKHVLDRHQAEHERLEREWQRWKKAGFLD